MSTLSAFGGAVIGGIVGGPPGAFIGATVGATVLGSGIFAQRTIKIHDIHSNQEQLRNTTLKSTIHDLQYMKR